MQRLLSIGQLIDHTWDAYRHRFFTWLNISAWGLVTVILTLIALGLYPTAHKLGVDATNVADLQALTGLESVGVILYWFAQTVVPPIVGILVLSALILAAAYPDLKLTEVWKRSRKLFWSMMWVLILYPVVTMAVLIAGLIPGSLLLMIGSFINTPALFSLLAGTLVVIGTCIGFFYFVKWVGYYAFAPYTTVLSGLRGWAAFTESRRLVEGRFWSVLLRFLVPKLVFALFLILFYHLTAEIFTLPIVALFGWNRDLSLRLAGMLEHVLLVIPGILFNPFIVLSDVFLFNDLTNGTWGKKTSR